MNYLDCTLSDFGYLHSITPKIGVKVGQYLKKIEISDQPFKGSCGCFRDDVDLIFHIMLTVDVRSILEQFDECETTPSWLIKQKI